MLRLWNLLSLALRIKGLFSVLNDLIRTGQLNPSMLMPDGLDVGAGKQKPAI